jgi:transcriptional regulator with XRE-family HTH domain
MKTIEDQLRTWRSANNLTQERVADLLGVSQPTYNKWESGKSEVPFKYYATIAKVIEVKLSELVPDGVIAEVKDAQNAQSGFKLEVKDFLRVLEDNNGLLKLRCERLAAENKSLKEELRKCSGSQ